MLHGDPGGDVRRGWCPLPSVAVDVAKLVLVILDRGAAPLYDADAPSAGTTWPMVDKAVIVEFEALSLVAQFGSALSAQPIVSLAFSGRAVPSPLSAAGKPLWTPCTA